MEFNFWCSSGAELSILANAIAIYISQLYGADDLITISNFVETLGDMLSLLAGQKARCESSKNIKIESKSNEVITNSNTTQQTQNKLN